ncbi:hypothetical protein [Paremcibacter congregatus]|uniref:hypothetical protein n=1 Tax=Paremcibacter congregatus TaxID=2043170 RepID=UPI001120100A|nr:hypothetical protein [Paremcibacter congregatus]QDE27272.1 hypothetical protein FIV45_08230 [Paremcibacter congregatus]
MGGKSSSRNSTTSGQYDNRVINENDYEIDNSVRNEFDYEIDNSVRNEFDYEIDNSVRNDIDYEIDSSTRNDLGDGAIQAGGNVSVTSVDAGVVEDAFNFAENIAGESISASSSALSQAFNSTAGGVIDAGKDLLKYGGIGLAALLLIMTYINRNK